MLLAELLRTAVVMVLNDDGFNIPSEPARKSRILAKKYLEWCQLERNEHNLVSFSKELGRDVNAHRCLQQRPAESRCGKGSLSTGRLLSLVTSG